MLAVAVIKFRHHHTIRADNGNGAVKLFGMKKASATGIVLIIILFLFACFYCPSSLRFRITFHANLWCSSESRSGRGSAIASTRVIHKILTELLPNMASFLDAPCGDLHWMQGVRAAVADFDSKYTGIDIVPGIVWANRRAFPTLRFERGDLETWTTAHDLALVRDLLQHLSTSKQLAILGALRRTGSKFLLINFEPDVRRNDWVHVDPAPDWRPLNLLLHPFNLRPLREFESDGVDKHYGLFDLQNMGTLGRLHDLDARAEKKQAELM